MARFLCKCGKGLSTVQAPNDVELYVYTDSEWDYILNMGDLIDPLDIPDPKHDVWHCTNCDRIYVFNSDHSVKKVYKPDND